MTPSKQMSAAQCMLPGWPDGEPPVIVTPRRGDMTADEELHMAMLVSALQRVRTDPGSGDMKFIASVRGKRPASLALADRERVHMVARKYRAQLPEGLRPQREG